MMAFAKRAASRSRKSIYDSLELEEVVVDIEYYSSDNDDEEEQVQRDRRSPSIEDSKFGILAAATTLTSLRDSRPAFPPFHYRPQEQDEPRRKFNIAHLTLPSKIEQRPINIFVKHEVVAEPLSTSALVPIKLFNERPSAGPSSAFNTGGVASTAASAKFVITNPPIQFEPSCSAQSDHSYLLPDKRYGAFHPENDAMVEAAVALVKVNQTSSSASSSPCEVSSTIAESIANSIAENPQNGKLYGSEVPQSFEGIVPPVFQAGASCSFSPGLQNGSQPTPEQIKCSKCPKTFTNLRGLQSHMKAHKRRFRFKAKPQDMLVFDEEYDDPMDKDYEQRPAMASSSSLPNQTWTAGNMPSGSAVIKIEPPGDEPGPSSMFTCRQCNKRFSCSKGLKIHIKSHEKRALHNGSRKGPAAENDQAVEAPSFEEAFSMDLMNQGDDEDDENGADDLEGGAIVGNGTKPEGRMFLCTICGKRFCRRNHLVFHLRIHSGERPYPCGACPARFSRADSLKVHMRIHTGERPYVCDICGAAFAQMINANVHRRCHTGEKPFRCEECGARFIKKDGLTVHRRIHTGEKPYSCDQCGARFAYRSCILSHYKVHNGELLYRCEKCNAGFSLLCNLTRHKRVHAEEEEAA